MLKLASQRQTTRFGIELGDVDADHGKLAVNVGLIAKLARRSPSVEDTIAAMRRLASALRDPSQAGAIAGEIADAVEVFAGELDEQLRPSRPQPARARRRA